MAKTNLQVVEKAESKVKGDIDEFNLNVGFIEAVFNVLLITDSDEFNPDTIPALVYEARNKLDKVKDYMGCCKGSRDH